MEGHEISCAICKEAEPIFDAINRQINQAKTPKEKAPFAQHLIEKVEEILAAHGPMQSARAKACLSVLTLRKRTAELILKFQRP